MLSMPGKKKQIQQMTEGDIFLTFFQRIDIDIYFGDNLHEMSKLTRWVK